jgi:CRISPR-associated protein Csb2
MALIIEQRFPSGRFHATRWNQGAFGDAYGEWPPSPWRLLRALAARWFQYAREIGETKESEAEQREASLKPLLEILASSLPSFYLPPLTWRGKSLKQYQPTSLDTQFKYKKHPITKKDVLDYSYKEVTSTLNADQYQVVPPDDSLFWCWAAVDLPEPQQQLLDQLLERILYFGRAESFSQLQRLATLPANVEINCHLTERDAGGMVPVLAHSPAQPLDLSALLAATDDKEMAGRSIPPGTNWFYAQLPRRPVITSPIIHPTKQGGLMNHLQFALGGRVYPPLRHWVKVTNRFRGTVLRELVRAIAPEAQGRYDRLTAEQREQLALMVGKDAQGKPLQGHRHTFFLLWPDENGMPTRLIAWRSDPFTKQEEEAMYAASERLLFWEDGLPEWSVRLVPLPPETPVPNGLFGTAHVWESATPFVPPAQRHRFRRNGRERAGESVERLLHKMLQDEGKPLPDNITILNGYEDAEWVTLHQTRDRRMLKAESRTPWVRPGFRARIEFSQPIPAPLIVGDSCHFGLGLFLPVA